MTRALVIVDIQNDYFPGGRNPLEGPEQAAAHARELLDAFRASGEPVVHMQHVWDAPDASFMVPGTAGVEIHDSVRPAAGETVLQKANPNSFLQTPLEEHLRGAGVERLVVCGMMTAMCVDATVRAAVDLGFETTLAHDACATMALGFGGRTIPAADVHAAFVAALADGYAEVVPAGDVVRNLGRSVAFLSMADVDTEGITGEEEAPDPERERERERERREHHQMAMRLVRQYPDPALRVPANAIAEVDDEVRNLVERMSEVMRRSHGVGLAAPQVGVLRRVFVYRGGADEPVRVLINPELGERSEETEVDTEGCLSLLGGEVTVPVERHVRVVAVGLDESGATVEVAAEGLEARVIQHEIDHLDGVLIIDRAPKEDRRAALRELRLKA